MTNEQLDAICENVESHFVRQIAELSNSELEYVAEQLVNKFDGILERVREAQQSEGQ